MKRAVFLMSAVALAALGTLMATNVVNVDTDRVDRWIMILCFGGAAAFIGLASSDSSSNPGDAPTNGRAATARKPGEGRVTSSELPPRPSSLLKQVPAPIDAQFADEPAIVEPVAVAEAIVEPVAVAEAIIEPAIVEPVAVAEAIVEAEPYLDVPIVEVDAAAIAVPGPLVDPVDAELQSLIDDDQIQEITDLVEAADVSIDPDLDLTEADVTELVPGSESVEPLARLELRLADYNDDDLRRVVKESEAVVIAEMVRSGQLTSEGALTEKDIASMVFLAYTSDEMLTELRLRKTIDQQSHDQPGLEATTGSAFAPLKNIE